MYLQWYLELLRLYCRFDSYRERSILSGNERKIIAVFFVVFLLTANQKMSIFANIANSKIIVDLLTGMKSYNAAGVKGCKFL
jgi:hypothetical protein